MQYALVSSICKTTRRNMTLAVERAVKQQINLNLKQVDKQENSEGADIRQGPTGPELVADQSQNKSVLCYTKTHLMISDSNHHITTSADVIILWQM